MTKFAIILSGCGQHDGSETHETILTLLAMEQQGVEWEAFAPDIMSNKVINHVTNEETHERRSVLQESARLVRGKIQPLTMADASQFDAIIFPGGMGAVTVLCDWFEKHEQFNFNSEVKRLIDSAKKLKKPLGFICIAPMMISKIYEDAVFTIGTDQKLAQEIESQGGKHKNCLPTEVVIDCKNKIVSTPANMVAKSIVEVQQGISKLIQEVVKLTRV